MSFVNLANMSFSRNSKQVDKIDGPSTQFISKRINECMTRMQEIRIRVDELQDNWKSLCEEYSCMSFAKTLDSGVKESLQKAIDDLRMEYNDTKATLDFYKALKNKTLLEADIRISNDDMFDPSSISLRDIAKKAQKDEDDRKEQEELNKKREILKEKNLPILARAYEEMVEDGDVEKALNTLFDALVPSSGKSDTIAGELIRAIVKIIYRDFNDGDMFYTGYGIESSCGNAASFLMQYENDMWYDDFDDIRDRQLEDDEYTNAIYAIAKNIIEYIYENRYLVYEPNTKYDYLKYDTKELEANQPNYDYTIGTPDDIVWHIDQGHIDYSDVEQQIQDWFDSLYYHGEVNVNDYDIDFSYLTRDQLEEIEAHLWSNIESYIEDLNNEFGDSSSYEEDSYDEE